MKHLLFLLVSLFACFLLTAQQTDFSINELTGKVVPKNSDNPYKLRGEVYDAFLKMQQAAARDTIQIQIVSSYRSFTHQQRIWNTKYNKYTSKGLTPEKAINKIIEYSTIPGTSRHHWGTDIDIIQKIPHTPKNVLISTHYESNGVFCELKQWMDKYAADFGFELVYTNQITRPGFKYEPWHYSYSATSKKMLAAYLKNKCIQNAYRPTAQNNKIVINNLLNSYVKTHVLGINPTLIQP